MVIVTRSLDRAAFFLTLGGELTEIYNNYPNNRFGVSVPRWLAWYERAGGWIPYNVFCNQRRRVKRRARKKAGLPLSFMGDKDTGFKILDLLTSPFRWKKLDKD